MCSPALQKATAALQATFGPYLGGRPEVEHDFYGRGILVGLPHCHINDGAPLGNVEFASQPDGHFPDYHDLKGLKLVLYSPEDKDAVVGQQDFSGRWGIEIMCSPVPQLELMARIVDQARALGIALNLPAGSYVRKEVSRG